MAAVAIYSGQPLPAPGALGKPTERFGNTLRLALELVIGDRVYSIKRRALWLGRIPIGMVAAAARPGGALRQGRPMGGKLFYVADRHHPSVRQQVHVQQHGRAFCFAMLVDTTLFSADDD